MAEYEEIVKSAYQSAVELRNAVESLPGMDDQQQSEGVLLTIGWGGLCLEHARCAIWSAMAGNTRSAAAHLRPMEDAVIGTVWASEARDTELKHADGAINDLVESGRTEPPAEWSETGRAVWAGVLKEILQEKEDDRTRKGGLSSFMHAGSKGVGYAWSNDGFGDEWIKAAVGGRLAGRVHRAQSAAAAVMVMAAGGNPQATLAVLAEICKQDRNILRLNRPVAGEPGLRRKLSTLQNETRSLGMEVILREEILKLAGRTTAEPTSGKAEHLLEEVAQKQAEIRLKEVEGYRLVTSGTWSIQHLSSQPYDAARMVLGYRAFGTDFANGHGANGADVRGSYGLTMLRRAHSLSFWRDGFCRMEGRRAGCSVSASAPGRRRGHAGHCDAPPESVPRSGPRSARRRVLAGVVVGAAAQPGRIEVTEPLVDARCRLFDGVLDSFVRSFVVRLETFDLFLIIGLDFVDHSTEQFYDCDNSSNRSSERTGHGNSHSKPVCHFRIPFLFRVSYLGFRSDGNSHQPTTVSPVPPAAAGFDGSRCAPSAL